MAVAVRFMACERTCELAGADRHAHHLMSAHESDRVLTCIATSGSQPLPTQSSVTVMAFQALGAAAVPQLCHVGCVPVPPLSVCVCVGVHEGQAVGVHEGQARFVSACCHGLARSTGVSSTPQPDAHSQVIGTMLVS